MALIVPSTTGDATSSTAAPAVAEPAVNMSLDDMIKARREKEGKARKPKAGNGKPTLAQQSVGRGKAKKSAAANARRGLGGGDSLKPSAMEVEKQIYRAQRTGPNKTPTNATATGGKRSRRIADVKARDKIQKGKKLTMQQKQAKFANAGRGPTTNQPTNAPTKKVTSAALAAMKQAGFQVPKGMKMVIQFAPNPPNTKNNTNRNTTQRGNNKGGTRNNTNTQRNTGGQGNTGGRGRNRK
eukprot:CAMPEP_0198304756 /NCGR_PEP_ID=MMETSP1449-20131203/57564_1 /TAXON_ID=420275 /ORGANISM="Attheya septentrionalis, Strain CCMP2084" /LENGTH=239 /DNA_ID=CAMNT_0044007285 /DNA_START=51 /DNA_END=770 /DNA_ORIENTATION=-